MKNLNSLKACLAGGAILFLLGGCGGERKPPSLEVIRPVKVTRAVPAAEVVKTTFSGVVQARQVRELAFRVAGKVAEILVKGGSEVTSGQLLVRLDPTDYEMAIRRIERNLASAQAAYEEAESVFKEAGALLEAGDINRREVAEAEGRRDSKRSQVEAIREQLVQARNRLAYTELRAPFSGFVSNIRLEQFEDVSPVQPVLGLVDPRWLEVRVGIAESLSRRIELGREVTLTFESLSENTFPGVVSAVNMRRSGVTGICPVTVTLSPSRLDVRPGMAVEISFGFRGREGWVIPASAVVDDPGIRRSYVWICAGGRVKKQKVELGGLSPEGVEVLSGMEKAELVVTLGVQHLIEGQRVRPVEEPEG